MTEAWTAIDSTRRSARSSITPTASYHAICRHRLVVILIVGVVVLRGTSAGLARVGIPIAPWLADALSLIAILYAIGRRLGSRSTHSKASTTWWFIAFLVVCGLSALLVAGHSFPMAALGFRSLTLAPMLVWSLEAADSCGKGRRAVSIALSLVVLINCLFALRQAIIGFNLAEIADITSARATYRVGTQFRLIGMQSTGQDLSIIVGAHFVWSAYQVVRIGACKVHRVILLSMVASGIVTLLALQRSALLGTSLAGLVALLYWFVTPHRRHRNAIRRVIGIAAVGLGLIAIAHSFAYAQTSQAIGRALSLLSLGSDHSMAIRQASTIPIATGLIRSQPLGYGIGATGSVGVQFIEHSPLRDFPLGGMIADNGFFFIALQLGVVGLAVWLGLLISWGARGRLTGQPALSSRRSAALVLAFCCGAMISGSFWGLAPAMSLVLLHCCLEAPTRAESFSVSKRAEADALTTPRVLHTFERRSPRPCV